MSYTAPKYVGNHFNRGGYMYMLAGHDGENYRGKGTHKVADMSHRIKKEAPQNEIDEDAGKMEPVTGGTTSGVVTNEIKIDRSKQPGQVLDRNGPLTDAVAMKKRQLDTTGETASALQYLRYGQKL